MTGSIKGSYIVLHIDSDRLAGVQVTTRGRRLTVDASCCARAEQSFEDAAQLGAWVGQVLRDAGLTARKVILVAARSEVVLKVLEFPAGGLVDEAEQSEAIRLQMARQLTMPLDESVIDWIPLGQEEGGQVMSVLAGAIHIDRFRWYEETAEAAGLNPVGIQLSSGGVATLAAEFDEPVLVAAPSLNGVEFVVAAGGHVLFARSVELPDAEPGDAARIERIAIEAKRTWMSYRVSLRTTDIESVVVVGSGPSAEALCEACAKQMEIRGQCLALSQDIHVRQPENLERCTAVQSLLGLAIRASSGLDGMDFLNPHRPPDTAARRRMVALAALFVLIVLGGVGYLLRTDRLATLEQIRAGYADNESGLVKDYLEYLGDSSRVEHLTRWDAMDGDYLGHLAWLGEHLPDPSVSQADRVAMAVAGQVKYEGRSYPGGKWSSPARLVISISGKVHDREVMLGLRDRLLNEGPYVVSNRGPDVADRFDYELATSNLSAPDELEDEPDPAQPVEAGRPEPAEEAP